MRVNPASTVTATQSTQTLHFTACAPACCRNPADRACPSGQRVHRRSGAGYTARVNPKPTPVTPASLPIGQVLQRSAPLLHLQQLVRDSNDRFEAIRSSLPGALAAHVRPGPVDALGWSRLAANPSVAAKLRQLQPRLEASLTAQGWPVSTIRIKVIQT